MARQKLGQHFLTDAAVVAHILRVVAPAPDDTILEIGPGRGALTRGLLEALDGGRLETVEVDGGLVKHLRTVIGAHDNWRAHHADIMQFDFGALPAKPRLRIVGNLPYQLSGPLLMRALGEARHAADMHFMLQLEVAERLCAKVGDPHYSALSVLAHTRAACVKLFEVEAEAFEPPPEVRSAFVRLKPEPAPKITDAQWLAFERLVRDIFARRRKKLSSALNKHLSPAQIKTLKLNPNDRPQNLSADDYIRIAQATLHRHP